MRSSLYRSRRRRHAPWRRPVTAGTPRPGRILDTPLVSVLDHVMRPGDDVEVVETRPDGSHIVRLNGALWSLSAASVEVLG